MKIPSKYKDLRRYVFKNDCKRVLLFALWILLWCVAVVYYNRQNASSIASRPLSGWRLWVLLAAVTVIGFFLFRIWKFFTDRAFSGVILSSDNLHDYSPSKDPSTTGALRYEFRLNTAILVRDDNQKKHRLRFEQKDGFYTYYYEGTRVIHLRGLPYPIRTDEKEGYICAACGRIHATLQSHCDVCSHSLIDPKDLENGI